MRVMSVGIAAMGLLAIGGCKKTEAPGSAKPAVKAPASAPAVPKTAEGTCSGSYPSYWQDPTFDREGMWESQERTNTPKSQKWTGSTFSLSDAYPKDLVEDRADWGWLEFDPFDAKLSAAEREAQATGYLWAIMDYLQKGNVTHGASGGDISKDWDMCGKKERPWFHMPFQTYDPLAGREFVHGLTREAPGAFKLPDGSTVDTTTWAVGFYNAAGAHTIGQVWHDGTATLPTSAISFAEGTVVGKLLFTTGSPEKISFLKNMPTWKANISKGFCGCKPSAGELTCSYKESSRQCGRSLGEVHLMQFDVAVRDSRAPKTGWVFGTFVADGMRKAGEKNPWRRISPLGMQWANDAPPKGQSAYAYPKDPRKNGLKDNIIIWDVADMLSEATSPGYEGAGHLGCNSRLNGPADNPWSVCMSCHMTASVPDIEHQTPPIFLAFPQEPDPAKGWVQCSPKPEAVNLLADQIYIADTKCASPFDVHESDESFVALQDLSKKNTAFAPLKTPNYANGSKTWLSLDYSLQLSISLVQWLDWQSHKVDADLPHHKRRPRAIQPAR